MTLRASGLRRAWMAKALSMAALALAVPWSSSAAESPRHRIGFLTPAPFPEREASFLEELQRLGFTDGKNIAIEYRSADGDFARLPALAEELVARKVDVIVAVVTQASVAAKKATATIPIVMVGVNDPVASGLVASLAQPSGNLTGTSTIATDVIGKQLQLLRELIPGARRVGALWNPDNRVFQQQVLSEVRPAAEKLGVKLALIEVRTSAEIDRVFATMTRERPDALLILADPLLAAQSRRIAELALRQRLPTVGGSRRLAENGILAVYGPDFVEGYRRAAWYVSRILKGAKPADLPVERTTKFEAMVNAKTAQALGVTISPALRAGAEIIE